MYRKWTFKYGSAAIIAATIVIALSLFANLPKMPFIPKVEGATIAVLLTDPPTVPAGTTQLNLTYNDVSLHVIYPNGTEEWVSVGPSGTVNLFSLVNMTQTLATITIPVNSTVDKVKFSIENVTAVINEQTYNVTSLSNTFVVNILNGKVNQTLVGVLIDFNPTLVQIQAFDENDATVYYYVLVPSANAVIVHDLTAAQVKVGTIIEISENHRVRLVRVKEDFSKNLKIVSASLTVDGNVTSLNVTLKNEGEIAFRVFGLTLHGKFNTTQNWIFKGLGRGWQYGYKTKVHPQTIPFKVNDTALIPLFGNGRDKSLFKPFSSVTIEPEETIKLNFTGVIAFYNSWKYGENPLFTITPIIDENYTIRLMGEGFQSYTVKATLPPP